MLLGLLRRILIEGADQQKRREKIFSWHRIYRFTQSGEQKGKNEKERKKESQ